MRDTDEQWVAGLVERSRTVVPDVPVDVAAAVHGGRRRRTERRAIGGGALALVLAAAVFGIPALPRPTTLPVIDVPTARPTDEVVYAEIVDAIPPCPIGAVATTTEPTPEWQRLGDTYGNSGSIGYGGERVNPELARDAQEPAQGAVPPGFEPVAAVTCRDATPPDSPYVVEAPVRLEGDLGSLLDFLAQPEPVLPGPQDPQCVLDYALIPPRLYLVDAAGRVIAPHWPIDRCGRAAEAGFDLLDALMEVAVWAAPDGHASLAEATDAEVPVAGVAEKVPACHDLAEKPSGLPRQGYVPPNFEPVLVAYCDFQGAPGGSAFEQVLLHGDLGPLLAFLAQESPVGHGSFSCTYDWQFPPRVYLVDAAGRAVAPHWPYDRCAHPEREGFLLLDALDEYTAIDEAVAVP